MQRCMKCLSTCAAPDCHNLLPYRPHIKNPSTKKHRKYCGENCRARHNFAIGNTWRHKKKALGMCQKCGENPATLAMPQHRRSEEPVFCESCRAGFRVEPKEVAVICHDCGLAFTKTGKEAGGGSRRHHYCHRCRDGRPRAHRASYGFRWAQWEAYVDSDPYCDACRCSLRAEDSDVDHDHGHNLAHPSKSQKGCLECVRAKMCPSCNKLEGFIRKGLKSGVLSGVTGRIAVIAYGPIWDAPFQAWLRGASKPNATPEARNIGGHSMSDGSTYPRR